MEILNYEGSPVAFSNKAGAVMINASDMAKPFNKQPVHWLRNRSTKEFINELCAMRNRIPSELISVTNGDNDCTWLQEDVALEFARWLSPKVAIWCNDQIKKLLTTGRVAIDGGSKDLLQLELIFAEKAASILSLNEVSKLNMMKAISNKYNMPAMLPDYVKAEDAALSATELLAKYLPGVSVREFNARLVEKGLLKTLQHKKKNGKIQNFRSVTQEGSVYGENFYDSHSTGTTQPKWYETRFTALCSEAGFNLNAQQSC